MTPVLIPILTIVLLHFFVATLPLVIDAFDKSFRRVPKLLRVGLFVVLLVFAFFEYQSSAEESVLLHAAAAKGCDPEVLKQELQDEREETSGRVYRDPQKWFSGFASSLAEPPATAAARHEAAGQLAQEYAARWEKLFEYIVTEFETRFATVRQGVSGLEVKEGHDPYKLVVESRVASFQTASSYSVGQADHLWVRILPARLLDGELSGRPQALVQIGTGGSEFAAFTVSIDEVGGVQTTRVVPMDASVQRQIPTASTPNPVPLNDADFQSALLQAIEGSIEVVVRDAKTRDAETKTPR
jgi:hypothetical protein